jgi:hypothetical protein
MGITNSTERHPDLNKPCPAPNQPFVANQTTNPQVNNNNNQFQNALTNPTIVQPIQANNASLEASKTINKNRKNKNKNNIGNTIPVENQKESNEFQNTVENPENEELKPEDPTYGSVTNSSTTPPVEGGEESNVEKAMKGGYKKIKKMKLTNSELREILKKHNMKVSNKGKYYTKKQLLAKIRELKL